MLGHKVDDSALHDDLKLLPSFQVRRFANFARNANAVRGGHFRAAHIGLARDKRTTLDPERDLAEVVQFHRAMRLVRIGEIEDPIDDGADAAGAKIVAEAGDERSDDRCFLFD